MGLGWEEFKDAHYKGVAIESLLSQSLCAREAEMWDDVAVSRRQLSLDEQEESERAPQQMVRLMCLLVFILSVLRRLVILSWQSTSKYSMSSFAQ